MLLQTQHELNMAVADSMVQGASKQDLKQILEPIPSFYTSSTPVIISAHNSWIIQFFDIRGIKIIYGNILTLWIKMVENDQIKMCLLFIIFLLH